MVDLIAAVFTGPILIEIGPVVLFFNENCILLAVLGVHILLPLPSPPLKTVKYNIIPVPTSTRNTIINLYYINMFS